MKIVKFKDGQYGVRRWEWICLSYTYYGHCYADDHWWFTDKFIPKRCHMSEEEAIMTYNKLKNKFKPIKIKRDRGKAIKETKF